VGFRVREIGRVWLGGKKGRRGECSVFGGAVGGRLFVSGRTEVDRQKFPPHGGTSIFFFGAGIHKLARQLHQERKQMDLLCFLIKNRV